MKCLPKCLAAAAIAVLIGLACSKAPPLPAKQRDRVAVGVGSAGVSGGVEKQPPKIATLPLLGTVPSFHFVDAKGRSIENTTLLGSVWIANFMFTRCGLCATMNTRLAEVRDALKKGPHPDDLRLVSFTVDPGYDTPPVMAAYGKRFGANLERWLFLTGTRQALWRTGKLGFKLPVADAPEEDAAMPIMHSLQLILVDRDGGIRGYYESTEAADVTQLRVDAARLLATAPMRPVQALPPDVLFTPWLAPRGAAQLRALRGKKSPDLAFRFTDRIAESGITYRHRATEDSGKHGKAVHYDHANSIVVADVDGDARLDLLFQNQIGRVELWRNLGGGHFEDATGASGIDNRGRIGVGASFADVDNDGDPDLFLSSVRGGNQLFENDGKGHFKDITERAGVGYSGHSSAGVFFDYDRDGQLDLFVANVGRYTTDERGEGGYYVGVLDAFSGHLKPDRSERSLLYHNEGGGHFRELAEEVGLRAMGWTGDAAPFDVNEDGFVDLYVPSMQGRDELWINEGGTHFSEHGLERFPKTPWGSMGLAVFDYDDDGQLDLFVTDMHTDMSVDQDLPPTPEEETRKIRADEMYPPAFLGSKRPWVLGNALYHGLGKGRFAEVSDAMHAENYWPWGPSVGDLNADGYPDVFVASGMGVPFRYGVNTLLINDAGERFVDAVFALGVEPRRDQRTATPWYELDCQALPEGFAPCPPGTDRVTVYGAISSRSAVIFDLDGDGDLDIVTLEFNEAPQVLVSDLAQRRTVNALQVVLVGKTSNRDGFGAVVRVKAGGLRQTQSRDGRTGYLSQSVVPLYFGLGSAKIVDEVEVRWPSGKRQVIRGPLPAGKLLRVIES